MDAGGAAASVEAQVPEASSFDAVAPQPLEASTSEAAALPDAGNADVQAQADACNGACPECAAHTDCERRGFPGGRCADGKCWAATAECSADGDCAKRGPEFVGGRCLESHCRPNPRWRCEPPPATRAEESKQLSVLVRDSLSLAPLPNLRAVLCQKLDLTCSAQVGETTTQSDGKLNLTVPANFAGYLKIEAEGYLPAMYFLPPALPPDGVLQPFPLLSSGLIADALAIALGAGLDRTRGHMMLIAEDCFGAALPGVTFTSPQKDSSTVQFYVRDLLPSTSATETAEIGNGGYLNFPPGTAVLNLKRNESALPLTTVSVVVRAGYVSVAYIRPDRR